MTRTATDYHDFDADLTKWGSRRHRSSRDEPASVLVRWAVIAAALLVVCLLADGALGDSIRLNDEAGTMQNRVTLDRVAELEGADAKALGSLVIAELGDTQTQRRVTLDQVRGTLDAAGVNWGRITLKGFTSCTVYRIPAAPEPKVDRGETAAPNVDRAVDASSSSTLGAMVCKRLAERAGLPAAELEITFSRRDAEHLERSVLISRYEIEPTGDNTLGLTPVRVWRYEGQRPVESFTLQPTVRWKTLALHMKQALRRGEIIGRDALELKETLIDREGDTPLTDRDMVAGQVAALPLRSGEPLYPRHIRSRVLVKRGELVTVRALAGSLVVKSKAKALDDGAAGELIVLRSESSDETFTATVTGRGMASVGAKQPQTNQEIEE